VSAVIVVAAQRSSIVRVANACMTPPPVAGKERQQLSS
jgi:hypothetical protein